MDQLEIENLFNQNKYIQVKEFISKDLCNFLTHTLLKKAADPNAKNFFNYHGDEQVPNALAVMSHEIIFETLLEKLWPDIELLTGKQLLPTYSYARLYTNGNKLEPHTDRPECEISVTIQLGRSHHYAWPIWMGNSRIDLSEGSGVVYKGCEIEHKREICDGPEGYYSGQVFLHYVDANGPNKDRYADNTKRVVYPNIFLKNRSIIMEQK